MYIGPPFARNEQVLWNLYFRKRVRFVLYFFLMFRWKKILCHYLYSEFRFIFFLFPNSPVRQFIFIFSNSAPLVLLPLTLLQFICIFDWFEKILKNEEKMILFVRHMSLTTSFPLFFFIEFLNKKKTNVLEFPKFCVSA